MIYTCITNNYDAPRTDGVYQVSPHDCSRAAKILSHLFVEGDSVWLDGNISLLVPEEQLVREWLGDADIAVMAHPYRQTVAEECDIIAKLGYETEDRMQHYLKCYPEAAGMPLSEANVIVRRNNSKVNVFNEMWWHLYRTYSVRDQVTFPLAVWMSPMLKINRIKGNVREHPWFKFTPHATH